MGRADYLVLGDWNAICDGCGRKFKGSKLKKRWDGLWVCPEDWEIRQPQDFVRGVKDLQNTPFSRTEAEDSFLQTCTLEGQWSVAGFSIPGCWVSGRLMAGV